METLSAAELSKKSGNGGKRMFWLFLADAKLTYGAFCGGA